MKGHENNNWEQQEADRMGWRYCYECVSPSSGSRLRVTGEAEAYFWYLLGYQVHRMLERAR